MIKRIALTTLLILSTSCLKKSSPQNSESQIVDLLNQNQAENALVKINQELVTNPTDELLYLKASALSMKAGVDVYALFPLLKVKIFDVAISQWSQNREFQRKANEQRTSTILSSNEINEQSDAQEHKVYKPLKGTQLDYKLFNIYHISVMRDSGPLQDSCTISFAFEPTKKKLNLGRLWDYLDIPSQKECEDLRRQDLVGKELEDIAIDIPPLLDEAIRKNISELHQTNWKKHNKEVATKSDYIKILGNLWTLIDLIPVLSKIPKIKNEDFKNLEEAQTILSQIKMQHTDKNDPLGSKARKQLIMLSALKMVAHFQNGFNLNLIKSPNDFLCLSNENAAQELIESENDALYIISAIEDPEIINKNQALFNDIKNKYQSIIQEENDHPEIKEEHIRKIKEEIETGRMKYCEQQ